jgi:hypothetical protein
MKLKCIMALLLGLGVVTCNLLAQQQGGFNFAARAREALAQPFTGITSSGSLSLCRSQVSPQIV